MAGAPGLKSEFKMINMDHKNLSPQKFQTTQYLYCCMSQNSIVFTLCMLLISSQLFHV